MKIRLIHPHLRCGLAFLTTILLLSTSQLAFGQPQQGGQKPKDAAASPSNRGPTSKTSQQGDPSPEGGAAACSCCGGGLLMIVVPSVIVVLNIALLIWVARDAKSRNMDSAVIWMILVMFTSLIGLVIYIFSRPQGKLMRCDQCGNSRLQASRKCPHCGNG